MPHFSSQSNSNRSHRSSSRFDQNNTNRNSRFNKSKPISSPNSGLVKKVMKLKTEKGRLDQSMFLIEGAQHILDVLKLSPTIIDEVFIDKDFSQNSKDEISLLKKYDARITTLENLELKQLSSLQTPQGILAKAYFSQLKINWTTAKTITILDSVQDPGNVGAIFRTALAMNHDAILLGKGTCEPYNPKVVRSSVGQFLRIPFEANLSLDSKISFLKQQGFTVISTTVKSKNKLSDLKLRNKVAFIIGNEGSGVNPKFSMASNEEISIPLSNKVESLNAAVCHGILCHELNSLRLK